MRIDHLILDASARGGIARSTFTMAGALNDLGHDVRVVSLVPGARTPALPWPENVRVSTLLVRRPGLAPSEWSPRAVTAGPVTSSRRSWHDAGAGC
jgi:hypothetical protein